jgi:KUP system potassium uptake protein
MILARPGTADNPLFKMVPAWALSPLVVLATAASVIASQAVISGAFSLTRQAIQLGFLPRMRIEHTSAREIGQIYLPGVNWLLLVACLWLVFQFGSSSKLAAAYGLAVTSTMAVTTLLLYVYARDAWHVNRWLALGAAAFFLAIDCAFLGANLVKVAYGGWVPLVIAGGVYLLMATWKRGRALLGERLSEGSLSVDLFLDSLDGSRTLRVPGTAVFMSKAGRGVPMSLLHNVKHNKVIHERVVFLTVVTNEVPLVRPKDRITQERLGKGFWRVTVHYGFMQDVDVPKALERLRLDGAPIEEMATTYFLTRETLIASDRPGMARWRDRLFAWMTRTHGQADAYFGIPPGRVVELGLQVEI